MSPTLAAEISERLKREIYAGRRAPGTRLPSERALSQALGVNRSAVREALKALEQGGLVETKRGSGTVVRDFKDRGGLENLAGVLAASAPELTRKTVLDALDFRVTYAQGIAEVAARQHDESERLKLQLKLLELEEAEPLDDWAEAERAFMNAMVAAGHNRIFVLLQNTLASAFKLQPQFARLLFAHRKGVELAYGEVLEAFPSHDEATAGAAMRALMEKERAWVRRALQ